MKELKVFTALWCTSCKTLKNALAATALSANLTFIDIDNDPQLAKDYGIRGLPTLVLEENSTEIKRATGAKTSAQLQEFLL
jgi:thioredoxin 1